MTRKLLALPLAVALMAFGSIGSASAQTTPRVALQFASSGLTSPLTPSSSDAVLARLILDTSLSSEPIRINSIPFNLVVGSGAMASSLNNCRVYNEAANTVALNTTSSTTSMVSGLNTIVLNSSLILPANTVNVLSLRCDVAASLVSGGTYTVNMNTADLAAYGANTGFAALVTIRGAVVTPPVYTPPAYTPGLPSTGANSDTTRENLMILAGSMVVGMLGLLYARRQGSKA